MFYNAALLRAIDLFGEEWYLRCRILPVRVGDHMFYVIKGIAPARFALRRSA